jgi:molybdopterin-guanine dinucleotide biosynthesis protein A
MTAFGAIVLSGGESRRLGRPKTQEFVGGRPVLARVTDSLTAADSVVIVGDPAGAGRADHVVREDPPGGGPVAAIAAGLAALTDNDRPPLIVVTIAGDLPFVTATAVRSLVDVVADGNDSDVAVAIDDSGRFQYLLAAWRTAPLAAAIPSHSPAAGTRLGDLFDGVRVVPVALAGDPPPWFDCDTSEQLAAARRWAIEADRGRSTTA